MRFRRKAASEHKRKLDKFRQCFHIVISDGYYPHERQHRLYNACQKLQLNWTEARQYVQADALAFLQQVVERILATGRFTSTELDELQRLPRRLALADEQVAPLLNQVYDQIERKLEKRIIELAAYVRDAAVIATLKHDIACSGLPDNRAEHLVAMIERQHRLAILLAGNLPVVAATVPLWTNGEVCHMDIPVQALLSTEGKLVSGRLIITNQRVLIFAPQVGLTVAWPQIQALESLNKSLVLVASGQNAMIFCDDPLYVATLLAEAHKSYALTPTMLPSMSGQ